MPDTLGLPTNDRRSPARHLPLPAGAFRVQRPIRFSHTDPAGIVYFPVYFDMFNGVVEDWFTHGLGINYADLIVERRIGLPIVHAECDFVIPSRMGETLTLGVMIERIGRSSIDLRINGEVGGAVRLCGRLTVVATALEGFGSIPLPDDLRASLQAYQTACDACAGRALRMPGTAGVRYAR
ncbi:acyl-CoA thioesterase [Azospirillum thermophilum]|uniref:Acyl-CoA thioesterase n=1 Tax=Azospirillum thermophilum TaxID=2202148 RepID=A0A2S2CLU9_9PROT|nr:thioesterase family protein [Azospirillum thermophilum]AWK85277.1 acyl-CoA thioesterase [Azospirillum thermophilum]